MTAEKDRLLHSERSLLDRLRVRHNASGGNGPKWVFMEHVRSCSGFDARSTIDGLAIHLWQSKKHEVHAYEVKISRSDFRRELADDRYKSAIWREWVDYFWIVAPKDVVPLDELPDGWGLMVPHGPSVRVARSAKRLRPEPTWHGEAPPIARTIVASMLRAAAKIAEPDRDNPVTDHQQDWCEHEMSQCAGGCPPYGYCASDAHIGDVSPDWPCDTALRALGETRAEWIAKHEAAIEAHVDWMQQEIGASS